LAHLKPNPQLLGAIIEGHLQIHSVHVDKGRSISGPDLLIKVDLVGEDLANVKMNKERRWLSGNLQQALGNAPSLENLG
jgi:hypothetical protein